MARLDPKGGWEKYVLIIIGVGLGIVALVLVIGPQGAVKEATQNIKAQDKRKIEKKELFEEARKKLLATKPKGKKWSELETEDLDTMAAKVTVEGLNAGDIRTRLTTIWREECVNEQTLPSDDPSERWKQMTGSKFETIRMIWLKDETGALNSPQVEVYADSGKAQKAGEMSHEQWVEILEEKGPMTRIKRRSDKLEAWVETKYLKRVYTKEDIRHGPSKPKPKDGDTEKPPSKSTGDEWD